MHNMVTTVANMELKFAKIYGIMDGLVKLMRGIL